MTALLFIIVISVLIFVHELGHFVMAKRAGMKVEEFGFGFPPRLVGFRRGETVYSINWIPFGGFVKIYGEDGGEHDNPRSFGSKPFFAKMKVILAGVVMNLLFAMFLLMIGNSVGLRKAVTDEDLLRAKNLAVQIYQIAPDSPAEQADIRILDEILGFRIGNTLYPVRRESDVVEFAQQHRGETVTMLIHRGSEALEKQITLRANPPAGQGPIGVAPILTGEFTYPWYESIWRGVTDGAILVVNTLYGYWSLFSNLFTEGKLGADVSGPVGIASLTGQAARVGFNFLLQFVAMISINLAILNAVPFPALDGGRAFLLIVEKVRGKALNKHIEGMINATGFAVLLAAMAYITFRDIVKFF